MRFPFVALSFLCVVNGMSVVPGDLNKSVGVSNVAEGKSPLATLQGLVSAGHDLAEGAALLRDETVEVLIGGKDKASDIAADFVRSTANLATAAVSLQSRLVAPLFNIGSKVSAPIIKLKSHLAAPFVFAGSVIANPFLRTTSKLTAPFAKLGQVGTEGIRNAAQPFLNDINRAVRPLRRATQPIHAALDPIRVAASTGLLGVNFQRDIDQVDIDDDIRALKRAGDQIAEQTGRAATLGIQQAGKILSGIASSLSGRRTSRQEALLQEHLARQQAAQAQILADQQLQQLLLANQQAAAANAAVTGNAAVAGSATGAQGQFQATLDAQLNAQAALAAQAEAEAAAVLEAGQDVFESAAAAVDVDPRIEISGRKKRSTHEGDEEVTVECDPNDEFCEDEEVNKPQEQPVPVENQVPDSAFSDVFPGGSFSSDNSNSAIRPPFIPNETSSCLVAMTGMETSFCHRRETYKTRTCSNIPQCHEIDHIEAIHEQCQFSRRGFHCKKMCYHFNTPDGGTCFECSVSFTLLVDRPGSRECERAERCILGNEAVCKRRNDFFGDVLSVASRGEELQQK